MRDRPFDEVMAEIFREDPGHAVELLNAILEDGDQAELMVALRQMSAAFGGVYGIAREANLNPTQLYRTLSAEGNPVFSTLTAVLRAMGLRLSVTPLASSPA